MRFSRVIAFLACSVVVSLGLAQTTLTPGQMAAIRAAEAKRNAGLAENGYQFTHQDFTLDSIVEPVPWINMKPPAGSVEVRGVEHDYGGKNTANQGYWAVWYWLTPHGGDTWTVGQKDGPMLGYSNFPTLQAAKNVFHQKEVAAREEKQARANFFYWLPGIIKLFLAFVVIVGGTIWAIVASLKKGTVPKTIKCPSCGTINEPRPSRCFNCGGSDTVLVKRKLAKGYAVTTACHTCKHYSQFDPYCVKCETKLDQLLLQGSGSMFGAR